MANEGQNRALPALLTVAAFALVVIVVFAVRALTHDAVKVRVSPVTYQTLSQTASTNGKVEPVEEYQAHAPFPGVIQKIYVDVGDKIRAGELLLAMDASDAKTRIAAAEANLQTARLGLNNIEHGGNTEDLTQFAVNIRSAEVDQQTAAQNLATLEKLQAKGAASASEVKMAQDKLTQANLTLNTARQRTQTRYSSIDVDSAKARVAESQAALAAARDAFAQAIIHSPIAGTVYSVPVSQFDYVPGGDDLMDIADLTRIQVRAYFDEPEIGKLISGQPVKIVWDAKPLGVWHGHIARPPATVITYGTRNVGECIITVDDAKGDLLPNTNVTVTVTEKEHKDVLSIPREALHTEGNNNYVYRIIGGRLQRTPVKVDIVTLTNVQILSGLNNHDVVVLGPIVTGQELTDGLEVKPVQ